MNNITPTECPKWDSCSAAVCPLNRTGKHLKDEGICLYAREIVKTGAKERFQKHSLEWLYDSIAANLGWLLEQSPDIKKRIKQAMLRPTNLTQPQKIPATN